MSKDELKKYQELYQIILPINQVYCCICKKQKPEMFICIFCPNTFYCDSCFNPYSHEHPCIYSFNIIRDYESIKFLPNTSNIYQTLVNIKKEFYNQ